MAAKINHGALDTLYGIIVQHADGSWSPYSQMGVQGDETRERQFAKEIYGGEVKARVVRFVARVLCDNLTCGGHDYPDENCLPSEPECICTDSNLPARKDCLHCYPQG